MVTVLLLLVSSFNVPEIFVLNCTEIKVLLELIQNRFEADLGDTIGFAAPKSPNSL